MEILEHHFKLRNFVFHSIILDLHEKALLDFLIEKYNDGAWDLYNFIVVVKNFHQSFYGSYTKLGALVYENMESDLSKTYIDLRIFQLCVEDEINEELSLLHSMKKNNFVFKLNLDRIINRDVVSILGIDINNILLRTKDYNLKLKIINVNLIYGVFIRFKHLIFLNKRNRVIEEFDLSISPEYSYWAKKILFTKGYVIIFSKEHVEILINLVYKRKIVRFNPINIEVKYSNKVRDSLDNKNYSHSIWMKNLNINDFKTLNENEIVNNILDDEFDSNLLINNLNFLNSIKISPNIEFFNIINNLSKKTDIFDKEYITRERLNESFVVADEGVVYIDNDKINEVSQEKLNCLSFINLVKIQYDRFGSFYMEYRRDGRVRIYNYNYPLNFQLSHLVRNTINIETTELSDVNIVKKFLDFTIWKELDIDILKTSMFFWQKLSEELLTSISKKFNIEFKINGEINELILINLKIESILIILESFAPKNIVPLEERIIFLFNNHLDELLKLDINNPIEVEKNLESLGITKKKMHVLKNIYTLQQMYFKNMYNEIFWIDASSNGIQLITLRLGKFNDLLLQLTNIIDNKTKCKNIYNYVTNTMKKTDHSEFLINTLKNKINAEEFNSLYDDDDNKDRIMPASYGKGKIRARKDMSSYINEKNNKIWNIFSKKEKDDISDYLWNLVFEILKNIDFDLGLYKEACKSFLGDEEKLVCWYNDSNFPIIPFKELKTQREKYLKQLVNLKLDPISNKERIDNLNKKIALDEKNFYKRTKIYSNNSFITPRLKHSKPEIDRLKTITSLTPNATHSYDASNMDKTLMLLKLIGLKALPIFDSLGSEIKYVSLIKILFKLANIENIEYSYFQRRFPYIEYTMEDADRVVLYKKILESSYFIR